MIQTVPKWEILVTWAEPGPAGSSGKLVKFWLFDNAIGNVLRTVAGMQFTEQPMAQSTMSIVVSACQTPRQQGVAFEDAS